MPSVCQIGLNRRSRSPVKGSLVLLLNFLCKVYSTNMTSLREREEKREKETLTAANSKAAAGSALSKGRCSKNGHCPKSDCRNALALVRGHWMKRNKLLKNEGNIFARIAERSGYELKNFECTRDPARVSS